MSSHNVREAQTILRLFPEARIIHALRDGRDSASSVTGKTWGPRSIGAAIGWWADRLRAIERGRPRQRGRRRLLDPRRPLPGRPARRPRRPRPRAHLRRACSTSSASRTSREMRAFFEQRDDRRAGARRPLAARAPARRRGRWVQRRYERTVAALEREGNHAAPSLRAALEREAGAAMSRAGPLRDQQRHRPRPSEPGDGDRAAAARRVRAVVLHPLAGRPGRRRAGLRRRLPRLLPPPGIGDRPRLEPAAARRARAAARRAPPRPRRLRRRPSLPRADPRAQPPRGAAARSGAGGRCGGPAPARRRCGGRAPSTPSSSPASSPAAPIAAPPSGGAPRRRGSIRSSCSIPSELLDRERGRGGARPRPLAPHRARRARPGRRGRRRRRALARARWARRARPAGRGAAVEHRRAASRFPPGSSALDGHLPDEPLLPRLRPRGRRRRLQRLPRADRLRASRRCSCRWRATPTTRPRARAGRTARAPGWRSSAPATRRSMIAALDELCDPAVAERICGGAAASVWPGQRRRRRGRPRRRRWPAASGRAPRTPRGRGRLNRWLRLSAIPSGPTLPLVLALGGRDLLRHPERRAPRLMILALGVAASGAAARLRGGDRRARSRRASSSSPTRSTSPTLRGLGVGFEHLPPVSAGRAPTVPERDAPADRAAASCSRGRKPLRAVAIGALAEEVLGVAESTAASRMSRALRYPRARLWRLPATTPSGRRRARAAPPCRT